MNGTRAYGLVVVLIVGGIAGLALHSQLQGKVPEKSKTKSVTTKTDAPTKTISGRVFDAHGKPLSDASVWLIRQDDSNFTLPEPTVIAEIQSRADGRFDLKPLVAELTKRTEDPYADFEIWVWKRGFALGHWAFFGEPIPQPISIFLGDEVPFALQLKTPKGDPCPGASVTPNIATFGYSRAIPKPLQDRLKTETAADGHIDIHGFNGGLKGLSIEKAEFGTQTLLLSEQVTSPLVATLHNTRSLEGRFVFPKGERVDPSQATVCLEVTSERMTPCKNPPKDHGDSALFAFRQEFSPTVDREGRFRVSGVLEHGWDRMYVKGFPDIPFVFDPPAPPKSPKPVPANGTIKFDIPLKRGIWCSVLIRDAQTKKPLPGVDFSIASKRVADHEIGCDEDIVLPDSDSTDSEGRIRLRVRPGETYRAHCVPCEGYVDWSANNALVHIPIGVDHFELPPIELARSCTIKGSLVDTDGVPLVGVRIHGNWCGVDGHGKSSAVGVVRWTKSDYTGRFQFEGISAGTSVTLSPVRAGIPLAEPISVVVGDDKPVRLREKREQLVALTGRVLDVSAKPIANAPVVVEVADSPDQSEMMTARTGPDGLFHTPARFPKQRKYRLTVRSMLDIVASSDWLCPAASGTRFADLTVERAKLGLGRKLSGKEVVARVNGQPIHASELIERAFVEPIAPSGQSLLTLGQLQASGAATEQEFRAVQDLAIKKYVGDFVRTRLLTQTFLATLDADQKRTLEEAVAKEFDNYLVKLKKDFHAATGSEVDRALREQGMSLAGIQAEFRYKLLSEEFLRQNALDSDLVWRKGLAHYQAHRDAYATGPKVNWQLLEINFDTVRPVTNAVAIAPKTVRPQGESRAGSAETEVPANRPYQSWADSNKTAASGSHSGAFQLSNLTPDSAFQGVARRDAAQEVRESEREIGEVLESAAAPGEHIGPEWARKQIDAALKQLHDGKSFEDVAKKFSDGPMAEEGGWQPATNPDSMADKKTAGALRQLAEGAMSPVIQTDHSLRIIRVVSRVPAGHKPFEEVEESIRDRITHDWQQKLLQYLESRAFIETAYPCSGADKANGAMILNQQAPELPDSNDLDHKP